MENTLKVGSATTITSFVAGSLPDLDNTLQAAQSTTIYWFQIVAFTVSIVVGILTACYYIKKLKTSEK